MNINKHSDFSLSCEIARKLRHRIEYEYSRIYQEYNLQGKISKAIINLSNATSYLGKWDGQHNSITLSSTLCLNYHWHEVIEVIKHEIAHQIVDQYIKPLDHHCAHDHYFVEACEMICVANWARSAKVHNNPKAPDSSELLGKNSSIEQKIDKLLNLARSSNQHEASLALEKVFELRQKYFLQSQNSHHKVHYHVISLNKQKRTCFDLYTSILLSDHFNVRCIFSLEYSPVKKIDLVTLELVGLAKDLVMANHVFYFLKQTCEYLWTQQKSIIKSQKLGGNLRSAKRSFIIGLIQGFGSKLELAKKKHVGNINIDNSLSSSSFDSSKAILYSYENDQKFYQDLIEGYFNRRYPKIKKSKTKRGLDQEQLKQGHQQGLLINLNPPVKNSSKSGHQTLLLS